MKKIILVEDDAITAKSYCFHLERAGYAVKSAADGEAGWRLIQQEVPDAVLLDLMMPRMSGVEVLRQIRAASARPQIPVFVFTNAYVPALIEDAKKAGANEVFDKASATPLMILEAIKRALGA